MNALILLAALTLTHHPDTDLEATEPADEAETVGFDRSWAIGIYGTGWGGPYGAGGIGGRLRFEAFPDVLGVEIFGESALVETAEGISIRHDHQVGFNLFIPIRLGDSWRIRPLFGFCTVFSFAEAEDPRVDGFEDIQFGIHAGVGVEWSFSSWFSVFADAQAYGYAGHSQNARAWVATLGDALDVAGSIQGQVGLQLHFGAP